MNTEEEQLISNSKRVAGMLSGLRPDKVLTVSEWSDTYRVLDSRSSAEPGPWRTDRVPYLREILDCLSSSSPIQKTILMKAAQLGATEAGNNWLGYIMHHSPGPILCVMSTGDTAVKNSKQRIGPMIQASDVLRELVTSKDKTIGATLLQKDFPGGSLMMTGAQSAANFRSTPVKNLFLDEVDSYPFDVEGEGDPVQLAIARANTYGSRRKIYMVSTPTIMGESRIQKAFESTDKRYYYVPCPHCQHMQPITWAYIRWVNHDPNTVYMLCVKCDQKIDENRKTWMLANGVWTATEETDDPKIRGYHLNGLYSPLGWLSWADIVRQFLNAKRERLSLKGFVNTILGESYEDDTERIEGNDLFARREDWGTETIPAQVLVITAGVDVQVDRLEIEFVGWAAGEESWSLEYMVVEGDPSRGTVWSDLDQILQHTFTRADGVMLRVACVCVDTGYKTDDVYAYIKPRQHMRIFGVKGQSVQGLPVVGTPTNSNSFKIRLFPVGSDTAKDMIYAYLKIQNPGPGYCHFPVQRDMKYFSGLTSERLVKSYRKGFLKREWKKDEHRANEPLDLRVYALVALHIINPKWTALSGKKTLVSRGRSVRSRGVE